jgi:uncharacterized protein (DUF1697 family)
MARYVALLRGINVGGKNPVKMTALAACFEEHGFEDVATYIQSGNVVFAAPASSAAALTRRVEAMLADALALPIPVVLRSAAEMQRTLDGAPPRFGTQSGAYRYDVAFLKAPLDAKTALAQIPTRPGVDEVHAGPGALYFRRLVAKASQSKLSRITQLRIYPQMTVRNWATTQTLARMVAGERS